MSQINDQLDLSNVTPSQRKRFGLLYERVKRKEMSANKAYDFAQQDGADDDDKGFKGSFAEWITIAQNSNWGGNESEVNAKVLNDAPAPQKSKTNYIFPILVGVGVAVVLIYAIKKFGSKAN